MKNSYLLLMIIVILLVVSFFLFSKVNTPNNQPNPVPTPSAQVKGVQYSPSPGSSTPVVTIGQRTKTSGCVALNGLADSACTPGAVFPGVTRDQVCTSGYSKSVRNVPTAIKDEVYREY